MHRIAGWICGAAAIALLGAAPASADVRAGVDAWSRGDYAAAVSEWEGPAAVGDPDAMFNLGQAYRLGRGVPHDEARAEMLYAQAAAAGHVQAADTYGLMLFQDGRREEALPYIQDAARRGDPRSQYLLGIAHYNGDIVPQDWVRAYALLALANGAGLPQAVPAIAEMDQHIPIEQRRDAATLAETMRREADSARAVELAAADLGRNPGGSGSAASETSRIPRPIATTAISPSIAAARAAIDDARRATGTENPAQAGAGFALVRQAAPVAGPAPAPVAAPVRAPAPPSVPQVAASRPASAAPAAAEGKWRVQLGAFGVAGNADRLWNQVSGRAELAGHAKALVRAGSVTKLQATGFASRADASRACTLLKQAGHDCLVTDN